MRLWLLCCALLFAAAQGYEWIHHQVWFVTPDLLSPWVIVGGVGLAIASNRLSLPPVAVTSPPLRSLHPTPPLPDLVGRPVPPAATQVPAPPTVSRQSASISFEIAKPKVRSGS